MDRQQAPDGTADAQRRPAGGGSRSDIAWAAALCFLIAMPLTLIDPPFPERATAQSSQRAYNLIFGSAYPSSWGLPTPIERAAATEVAVVLLDEGAAEELAREGARTWPAEARIHAAVLEAILAQKPRAVFVDLLFLDRMLGSTASFERAVARYGSAHGTSTPLFFVLGSTVARPSGAAPAEPCSCAQVGAAHRQGAIVTDKPPVTDEVWRLVQAYDWVELVGAPFPTDQVVIRSYPLSAQHAELGCTPTAAVCLYEAATGERLPLDQPDIFLFWNLILPKTNARWMECTSPPDWPLLAAIFRPESLMQTCATIPTVSVRELFQSEHDDEVQEAIEGNVVLYGANVTGGDLHPTAVTDSIAGVYVHAMAVDNLLAFGEGYLKSERRLGLSIKAEDVSVVVAAFVATGIAIGRMKTVSVLGRRRWLKWLEWLAQLSGLPGFVFRIVRDFLVSLLAGLLTIPISMALVKLFSLAPLNWLGVAALTFVTWEFVQMRAGEHVVETARTLWRFLIGLRKRGAAG